MFFLIWFKEKKNKTKKPKYFLSHNRYPFGFFTYPLFVPNMVSQMMLLKRNGRKGPSKGVIHKEMKICINYTRIWNKKLTYLTNLDIFWWNCTLSNAAPGYIHWDRVSRRFLPMDNLLVFEASGFDSAFQCGGSSILRSLSVFLWDTLLSRGNQQKCRTDCKNNH